MSLTCLKNITLHPNGSWNGFDRDGNFVASYNQTIFDTLNFAANSLKAPWMSKTDALHQAASCYNVKIKVSNNGRLVSVQAKRNR
jgi:hypothetical protein